MLTPQQLNDLNSKFDQQYGSAGSSGGSGGATPGQPSSTLKGKAMLDSLGIDTQTSGAGSGQTQEGGFFDKHPILKGAADAITSTVTQPAKALQQIGTGIGDYAAKNIHLPFEKEIAQGLGFTKENAPGIQAAFEGGVKPVQSLEEAGGAATQAAANLATPAALAAGPIGLGLQSAALSGGKAAEEGKSATSVAGNALLGGVLGTVLGKGSEVAGGLVGKGSQYLKEAAAPIIEKVMPFLSNVPKTYITFARANPEMVLPKMQAVAQAIQSGDMASAESALREHLLSTAKTSYQAAKTAAQNAYQAGKDAVIAQFPNAEGSLGAIRGAWKFLVKEAGPTLTNDEKTALTGLKQALYEHNDPSIEGFIKLKQKMFDVKDRLEQGTPGYRLASLMLDEADKELNRMTNGAMRPVNQAYAAFKKDAEQVRPIWSNSVKEDAARNFVQSLENQAKGGSLDAMKRLESLGGTASSIADEIKATKIAKAFNWEKAPTGSRIRDNLMSALFGTTGGALGSYIGGQTPAGSNVGAGLGATTGLALGMGLTSPALLSKVLMSQFEKEGIPLTGAARQAIGKIIADPKSAMFLRNMIEQLHGGAPDQKANY